MENPLLSSMLDVRPRRAAAQAAKENITNIYGSSKKSSARKTGERAKQVNKSSDVDLTPVALPPTKKKDLYEGVRLTPDQQKILQAGTPKIFLERLSIPPPPKPLYHGVRLTPEQQKIVQAGAPKVYLEKVDSSPALPASKVPKTPPLIDRSLSPHYRQILSSIYYDHSRTAGLASPRKLYLAAKHLLPRISLDQVSRWLASQKTYTVNRVPKKKFKRRKVIVGGIGRQYQADLMDMSARSRDGESKESDFILTVIDCFSRFADAVPIGRKTASNVLRGFEEIFSRMKIPKKIQTDDGKEFYNNTIKSYFREMGIIHFSTDQELKAQIVERFNRTLREKINKYRQANNTVYYHQAIPEIINAYNSSIHSSINIAPKHVNKRNEKLIWELQYGDYLDSSLARPKFKVGDVVRIAAIKKGFKRLRQHFKSELFVIHKVLPTRPRTYLVKSRRDGILVKGGYYEPQLQKVL